MCCCEKPTRNDELPGWNPQAFAPALGEDDELIYDECGRCSPQVNGTGCTDYHAYHFRLVRRHGSFYLLVRHGGGDEHIDMGGNHTRLAELLAPMGSDSRFLMLDRLYMVHWHAARDARARETQRWRQAAAENRIKTRKQRGRDQVKVWIEQPITV